MLGARTKGIPRQDKVISKNEGYDDVFLRYIRKLLRPIVGDLLFW